MKVRWSCDQALSVIFGDKLRTRKIVGNKERSEIESGTIARFGSSTLQEKSREIQT